MRNQRRHFTYATKGSPNYASRAMRQGKRSSQTRTVQHSVSRLLLPMQGVKEQTVGSRVPESDDQDEKGHDKQVSQ